ncbi:polyphosphate kinase 2 [Aureispira anguillae]|uniref:ADP/GDP-polyphosphate phosphotransferase n=1 Tax=Aureispira anguillae TaxID=2864201 RepID=A0A915YLH3_9BACT|nr:polyphosphate kinase 2 [Aureispira anguillae]BDS15112.1 polyphosphate kinase 2 [Aureispira anguillae]
MKDLKITKDDLERINTKDGYLKLLESKKVNVKKLLRTLKYEEELNDLQVELLKMQGWALKNNKRIAILFEGRDAAGKGGTIRRFVEHLNPRSIRIVALPKPTEDERGQWYFRRYINQLPNPGEIVFFDRSWYNRAVVEPVNGFCTKEQYDLFMKQVINYEEMLQESGVILIKFWLDTSKKEQAERFAARKESPLKQWKFSPIDEKAQELWDLYTSYRDAMFKNTHTKNCPWVVVQADDKKDARLAAIRYVLHQLDYDNKGDSGVDLKPDPEVVKKYKK